MKRGFFRKYFGKIVYKSYLVTNKCHVLGRNTTQQNKHPENREKKTHRTTSMDVSTAKDLTIQTFPHSRILVNR